MCQTGPGSQKAQLLTEFHKGLKAEISFVAQNSVKVLSRPGPRADRVPSLIRASDEAIGRRWLRVDENSGERVENYGGDLSIAADTAIVKDKVFGAINVIYDPEVMRLLSTGVWQREATLGFLAAITTQVQQGVFVGVEARYLRKYDALDVTAFAGDALFIGPTMFV